MILDEALAETETPQEFDVIAIYGSAPLVGRLRFTITDGLERDIWEMGEFEAWGFLF